ncbi:AzlD domain-containing protein [Paenibacillus sediminis]|uniref:Branched-subunit amino acid transport protein n=1 Tax=Paenibacillus sediminis TaxID=664909 RepID=A0ABS4H0D9_9BACL|nr:AzlD domain-containing protein [Paenibacillus sediminis]MBP1936002.1 branched-subunit amino acid transport protein [Paenibacillus sediminis]
MEVRWGILLIIIGAAIVTLIPRVLPLMLFSRIQIPDWGLRWLNHVPIAVMASLLAQELFMSGNKFSFTSNVLTILASLPSFAVAIITRSLLGTVIVGVVTMMLLRLFFS